MAKHPRKRQKTSKATEILPLGSAQLDLLLDEENKDDEERRLESMLFGKPYVPRGDTGTEIEGHKAKDSREGDDGDDGERVLQHLLDKDLFFMDDGVHPMSEEDLGFGHSDSGEDDDDSSEQEEEGRNGEDDADNSEINDDDDSPPKKPQKSTTKKPKTPAWTDPADLVPTNTVSLLSGHTRLRKLRIAADEDAIPALEYETRLRQQFERINPAPAWAKRARKTKHSDSNDNDDDEDENAITDLINSTNGILAKPSKKGKKRLILAGAIAIERLRDANQSVRVAGSGTGAVQVVAFHPSERVPVLCVASEDRRVRLFNVDGHTSPLLTTLHVPKLPLTFATSALFHPAGNTLLLTGPRAFFYTHDLQSGQTTHHSRGLWGSSSSVLDVSASRKRSRGRTQGPETPYMTAFSPSGDILAVAGRMGYVHLIDWRSSAGQVVGSLKCGAGGGGIQGMWWVPSSTGDALGDGSSRNASSADTHLAVMSGDAEVYIWDVGQRRCLRRWRDEGGFRGAGKVMAGTGAGEAGGYLAVGSNSGFVNVYGSDSYTIPPTYSMDDDLVQQHPKPIKTIGNLTTAISTVRFNHDAQIMAIASKEKKDSMRLIHLPSLTSFSNWPTSTTPLGHVSAVDFSARSEYVAIGNTRGRVLLYHLRDYGAGGSTLAF